MKKERKESLIYCFPKITAEQSESMKGKGAKNFAVFLTHGSELFVRCFHRYSDGKIAERQRYVFAKDGAVRYGSDNGINWSIRSEFREPLFCVSSYGYSFDNTYSEIGIDAIDRSDMRYSEYRRYKGSLLMCYLQLYCRHPNLEYLMKQGYDVIDEVYSGYWGGKRKLVLSARINWKSNDLLKMLGLSKTEFNLLRGQEYLYDKYITNREKYPRLAPQEILNIAVTFGYEQGMLSRITDATALTPQRIARYFAEKDIQVYDYLDYMDQCKTLRYDLHDTAISLPHDFHKMHQRLSDIIKYEHDELAKRNFAENTTEREKLEFSFGDLLIRQPKSMSEIVEEGKVLCHCVGGYAERHANGKLHILFLRKIAEPDVPYYTIEVSTAGKIVQCRGYKNNVERSGGKPKPQEIIEFEKEYQKYLDKIFVRENKKKERRSA